MENRLMATEGRIISFDNIQWETLAACLYHSIQVITFECTVTLRFSNLRCFGFNLLLKKIVSLNRRTPSCWCHWCCRLWSTIEPHILRAWGGPASLAWKQQWKNTGSHSEIEDFQISKEQVQTSIDFLRDNPCLYNKKDKTYHNNIIKLELWKKCADLFLRCSYLQVKTIIWKETNCIW